jgi:hypothetical protein
VIEVLGPFQRITQPVGYISALLAQQNIGRFLMERYNWRRPYQFNEGLAPAVAEEKLNTGSGISVIHDKIPGKRKWI